MTAFDQLQELIDLLDTAPEVTELSMTSSGGAQITVRRARRVAPPSDERRAEPGAPSLPEQVGTDVPDDYVTADRVGIFRNAVPPIERGRVVSEGQVIGYIESMKLMNEVRPAHGGTVLDVLVDDGVVVEYGQPLLRLATEP